MRSVTVAATQRPCGPDHAANLDGAEALVREAAAAGANVVLLQELFESEYFCRTQDDCFFAWARPLGYNPILERFQSLAAELRVVLPFSFFEAAGPCFFNSVAMIDADGALLGTYRKSHIPDGGGYQEKYYFSPGDTGLKVWTTRFGRLGLGICWDQWFPEVARVLALQGAELLLYPTAIGSEPPYPDLDTSRHWQRTMQGHAAANLVPVVASNRVGAEGPEGEAITFYGTSFITSNTGAILAEADRSSTAIVTATFDLDEMHTQRVRHAVFRDRRPDLYRRLLSLDGTS